MNLLRNALFATFVGVLLILGIVVTSMEWFVDYPRRGETALWIMAFAFAAAVIWLGRRRLILAIPVALAFLLLAAIAIPSAIPARRAAQRNACIHHLGKIRDAKIQWAGGNNKLAGDVPAEDDLYGANVTNGILRCPRGGNYTIGALGQNPTCSLSGKGHRLE